MFDFLANDAIFQILRAVLDIAVLSISFYFVYRLFRIVKIPMLISQISLVFVVYILASLLRLDTVLWIFKNTIGWIITGLLLVFQPELRALVMRADYSSLFRRVKSQDTTLPDMDKVTRVINYLIRLKRGALFVFPRHVDLDHIITSKVEIDADLTVELLQTIFSHDTVLHDGAVIIKDNRITHAGCFLPTERAGTLYHSFGSRHRAALGLSQNSDAIVLVLSEEFGSVSLVFDGTIRYDIGVDKACAYIEYLLQNNSIDENFFDERPESVMGEEEQG